MKRTILILGGIGLFCFLLIIRLFFKQGNRMDEEREWFATSLRYEFSARVDSIKMLNENTARLLCRVTAGDPQSHREDSLKRSFKEHDMLYLIFEHSGDSILFLIPDGRQVAKGDSVVVSSSNNAVTFFRDRKQVTTGKLADTFTGWGRPFFLKRK